MKLFLLGALVVQLVVLDLKRALIVLLLCLVQFQLRLCGGNRVLRGFVLFEQLLVVIHNTGNIFHVFNHCAERIRAEHHVQITGVALLIHVADALFKGILHIVQLDLCFDELLLGRFDFTFQLLNNPLHGSDFVLGQHHLFFQLGFFFGNRLKLFVQLGNLLFNLLLLAVDLVQLLLQLRGGRRACRDNAARQHGKQHRTHQHSRNHRGNTLDSLLG